MFFDHIQLQKHQSMENKNKKVRGAGLNPIFDFVVVCSLFPLCDERVHALVGPQEAVHAHHCFERQDAFHASDHVHQSRGAYHWLVSKNCSYGLLHTVIWFQRWEEGLNFFPYPASTEHTRVHQVRAHKSSFNTIFISSLYFMAQ